MTGGWEWSLRNDRGAGSGACGMTRGGWEWSLRNDGWQ